MSLDGGLIHGTRSGGASNCHPGNCCSRSRLYCVRKMDMWWAVGGPAALMTWMSSGHRLSRSTRGSRCTLNASTCTRVVAEWRVICRSCLRVTIVVLVDAPLPCSVHVLCCGCISCKSLLCGVVFKAWALRHRHCKGQPPCAWYACRLSQLVPDEVPQLMYAGKAHPAYGFLHACGRCRGNTCTCSCGARGLIRRGVQLSACSAIT